MNQSTGRRGEENRTAGAGVVVEDDWIEPFADRSTEPTATATRRETAGLVVHTVHGVDGETAQPFSKALCVESEQLCVVAVYEAHHLKPKRAGVGAATSFRKDSLSSYSLRSRGLWGFLGFVCVPPGSCQPTL